MRVDDRIAGSVGAAGRVDRLIAAERFEPADQRRRHSAGHRTVQNPLLPGLSPRGAEV